MQVDQDICVHISVNGWFDPTLDPYQVEDRRMEEAERQRQARAVAVLLEPREERAVVRETDGTTLPYILERL